MSVTDPIFTELMLTRQVFMKNLYIVFCENLRSGLVDDTRSLKDRWMGMVANINQSVFSSITMPNKLLLLCMY
jgi:hypothetical protein